MNTVYRNFLAGLVLLSMTSNLLIGATAAQDATASVGQHVGAQIGCHAASFAADYAASKMRANGWSDSAVSATRTLGAAADCAAAYKMMLTNSQGTNSALNILIAYRLARSLSQFALNGVQSLKSCFSSKAALSRSAVTAKDQAALEDSLLSKWAFNSLSAAMPYSSRAQAALAVVGDASSGVASLYARNLYGNQATLVDRFEAKASEIDLLGKPDDAKPVASKKPAPKKRVRFHPQLVIPGVSVKPAHSPILHAPQAAGSGVLTMAQQEELFRKKQIEEERKQIEEAQKARLAAEKAAQEAARQEQLRLQREQQATAQAVRLRQQAEAQAQRNAQQAARVQVTVAAAATRPQAAQGAMPKLEFVKTEDGFCTICCNDNKKLVKVKPYTFGGKSYECSCEYVSCKECWETHFATKIQTKTYGSVQSGGRTVGDNFDSAVFNNTCPGCRATLTPQRRA